jgi:hypothetical protein
MSNKTELLALRDNNDYFRLRDDGAERCTMAKASVFPLNQIDFVKEQLERLPGDDLPDVRIVKLVITEEPYTML